ncbi:MAG: metalloregulator ArsR/SmtB family transcription factor [Vulcanimicrobiaceae bacterium]
MVTTLRRKQHEIVRAIADPTRRDVLRLLRGGPQTVGEIAGHFRTSRPAISKHLRIRRSAGLIVTRANVPHGFAKVNPQPLRTVSDWVRD